MKNYHMKKKIFVAFAAVLLTIATTYAKTYIYTIDCGDGILHQGYIGGVANAEEAMSVAWDIADAIC